MDPEDSLVTDPPQPVPPVSSATTALSLDLFQHTVLLTEGMNPLKCRLNTEKQSRCENPAHLNPILSNEEELHVPISYLPILPLLPSPPATGPTIEVPAVNSQPALAPDDQGQGNQVHIPTLPLAETDPINPTSLPAPPSLTPTEWSTLIAKDQTGVVPTPDGEPLPKPNSAPLSAPTPSSHNKVFTADVATFSLDPEPGTLPDCLIQMALNCIFIPLSMLTTVMLNNIEMNQDIKYKCITYSSGVGKTFLDEATFPTEDELSDFEFGQAYTNWLTLIEIGSDPVIEQGWRVHHKRLVSDRGFQDWVQAWHTHDCLL